MADAPIKYQSQLPALLTQLLGEKSTTSGGGYSTTSTANTDPLMQIFGQQMDSATPGGMQALLQQLFTQGAQQVPQLTQAYANATGSRSTGNSGLSLALGDLNKTLAQQAATLAMDQQQRAAQTAGSIATASRGENRSSGSTTTQKGDPGQAAALGFGGLALNAADKFGWFKKNGAVDSTVAGVTGGAGVDFPVNVQPAMDTGGGNSLDGFLTLNDNFGTSGGGDASSVLPSYSPAFSDIPVDWVDYNSTNDSANAAWDAAGGHGGDTSWWSDMGDSIGSFFGGLFADGGPTNPHVAAAQGKGILRSRNNVIDGATDAAGAGQDPNLVLQAILASSMRQAPVPAQQFTPMPPPNLLNFLRYLTPGGPNTIYNYADGGSVRRPGFADGGTPLPRNFNNMGPRAASGPVRGAVNYSPSRNMSYSSQSGGSLGSSDILGNPTLAQELEKQLGGTDVATGGFTPGPQTASNNNATAQSFGVTLGQMGLQTLGPVGMLAAMAMPHVTGVQSLQSKAINDVISAAKGVTVLNESDPTADNTANALDGFLALNDNFGTGAPSAGPGPGGSSPGDGSVSAGDASAGDGGTGAGDGSGSGGGTASAANGGKVRGKGTGISDSINAKVSDGEFIISKDVVDTFGVDFFQMLQNKFHTPAAVQRLTGVK